MNAKRPNAKANEGQVGMNAKENDGQVGRMPSRNECQGAECQWWNERQVAYYYDFNIFLDYV